MYCPKCGFLNAEDAEYCRMCGSELRIISQVIKGRLPVTLAGKLDDAIEKPYERFRRDALLMAIVGVVNFVMTAFLFSPGMRNVFLITAIFAILSSGWSYLAYHRSLTRKRTQTRSDVDYCPKCGSRNLEHWVYCCSCGMGLNFDKRPYGIERFLPSVLLSRLDNKVTRNEMSARDPQSVFRLAAAGLAIVAWFPSLIFEVLEGNWAIASISLVLWLEFVVIGGWDLAMFLRHGDDRDHKKVDSRKMIENQTIGLPEPALSPNEFDTRPLDPQAVTLVKNGGSKKN